MGGILFCFDCLFGVLFFGLFRLCCCLGCVLCRWLVVFNFYFGGFDITGLGWVGGVFGLVMFVGFFFVWGLVICVWWLG